MDNHLILIKNDDYKVEKRILPRFPFSYLTFKGSKRGLDHVFEVVDISFTGMQIALKAGNHTYAIDEEIEGIIHWRKVYLKVKGTVKWLKEEHLGVGFSKTKGLKKSVQDFLSVDNIVASMWPVHETEWGLGLPCNLKYWLRADCPVEIFVWQHKDGELSRFQMVMIDSFVEWEDGKGVRTGAILGHRNLETPLSWEDEFTLKMDESEKCGIL